MAAIKKHAVSTKRYVGQTPRTAPTGRIVIHNHVRPVGFPDVFAGQDGFRVWTDVRKPKEYRVAACRCGWAPHLRQHFRMLLRTKKER
jgi:hypothetical protein